jgi:hypothetical protein
VIWHVSVDRSWQLGVESWELGGEETRKWKMGRKVTPRRRYLQMSESLKNFHESAAARHARHALAVVASKTRAGVVRGGVIGRIVPTTSRGDGHWTDPSAVSTDGDTSYRL